MITRPIHSGRPHAVAGFGRIIWVLAVSLCAADSALGQGHPKESHTVLKLHRGRDRVFAKGSISGQDVGYFGVDTGSNQVHITADLAKQLSLRRVGTGHFATSAGVRTNPVVWIDQLSVAGLDHNGLSAGVADDLNPRLPCGEPMAGILGLGIFDKTPFTLDLRLATLTLHRPKDFAPPAGATEYPLRNWRGTPLVRCLLEGHPGWFLLDTGHPNSVVAGPAITSAGIGTAQGRPYWLGNGRWSDAHRVTPTRWDGFQFLGQSLPVLYGLRESEGEWSNAAGLVGGSLLRDLRLTFDLAGRRLWVEQPPEETPDEFIERFGGPDARDLELFTPLHHAAWRKRPDVVRALLERGADVEAANTGGVTPLVAAASRGDTKSVELLLERGARPSPRTAFHGYTALILAAQYGMREQVEQLLRAGADVNETGDNGVSALFAAADTGHKPVVQLLLDRGAEIDPKLPTRETPLVASCRRGLPDITELLIARGASAKVKTPGGTPLTHAAAAGDAQTARLLLKHGADPNDRSDSGTTALMAAAATYEGAEVVDLLLAAGADATARDADGMTALELALSHGNPRSVTAIRNAIGK